LHRAITRTIAGTAYVRYRPHPMGYPSRSDMAVPTTLAEAPMGVPLPPMSVPSASDHDMARGSNPRLCERLPTTGTIVAAKGMVSTNDDAMADQQAPEYLTAGSFAKDVAEDSPGEGSESNLGQGDFHG
jgi:hypothetical protein